MGKKSSKELVGKKVKETIKKAIEEESHKCGDCYLWLKEHMPPSFFEDVAEEDIFLIAHSLMGFDLQDYFAHIHLKGSAIVLCLNTEDADLKILKHYLDYGIKNYRTFVSNVPPPFRKMKVPLKIAMIYFSSEEESGDGAIDKEFTKEIRTHVKKRNPDVTDAEFKKLIQGMSPRFLRALTKERLILALDMFFRAKTRDHCQYEVRYNKDWKKKKEVPSMQIVFAWKNVPQHHFLYALAKVVHRHGLSMKRVGATYIDAYTKDSILICSVGLHGTNGKAAWDVCDVNDFLQELVTLKYFEGQDTIRRLFVDSGLIRGNLGNLLKSLAHFVHQTLVHADANIYTLTNVEEGLCRHPELTLQLLKAFEAKFHPENSDLKKYEKLKKEYLELINDLDTGNEANDARRQNILRQGINFVEHTLKTNFYRNNKTALCFRLSSKYLDYLPFDRTEKFPELPYAIFFMKGMYFIGFHIRFKDLSRGGLRTVFPQKMEQMLWERDNVFSECYNLAYTQQKKNKDIPEGGAKGVIFLEPYERLHAEEDIYKDELIEAGHGADEVKKRLKAFRKEQKLEYLYQTQRSYIESFITLLNCNEDGKLRAKHILDYYGKPEYIYLGPDENMHNTMIEWITTYVKYYNYKPGISFISSKPVGGINHKEFGVTSHGINMCMTEVLHYLDIDPQTDTFTIKISGGPDGDVAGNQILNLYKYYPKTAKLLAVTDVSGTIYDPKGLDLKILAKMFAKEEPIRFYPPEKLNEGGFLLDLFTKKEQGPYAQQTLFLKKKKSKVTKEWLSGNEMNHIFRHNVHQTKTDIFIPGGGRPRTLNEHNWQDFLDETGKPTSQAIVEGANLYLTHAARRQLEKLGVLIIKDSSANKGGVIASSFEVLTGLCMTTEEFMKEKPKLISEILGLIGDCATKEAELMLTHHANTGEYLTDISEWVSQKINAYKYELLDFLTGITLSNDPTNPLIRCLLNYCPKLLRENYQRQILKEIPDIHKKAIIATYLAGKLVYHRGLDWSPSIVDILPLIAQDLELLED